MAKVASHLPADEFAFQQSSPHSLRDTFSSPPAAPLSAEFNPAFDFISPSPEAGDDAHQDLGLTQTSLESRRASAVSSVSTFPGSVLYNEPLEELRTPSRSTRPQNIKHDSFESFVSSSSRRREHAAAFRNPSSVRALQMNDGDEISVTPPRRSGSQFSVRSHGSAQSAQTSPSKRFSRSSQSSPLKNGSKLKKEFPLVLLHCTLLPPACGPLLPNLDTDLFGALLPEAYRKRWAALQDRFAMAEVKTRGVLIPHPQEDYELLEERLLESLELEKPRIRSSHFLRRDAAGPDSGFESESQTDEESEDNLAHNLQCPDCGKGIDLPRERKWEIKVYAANGLMRAGAWAAAWREMEKVDVEIGLWMPEDVRQEVNARLDAIKACEHDSEPERQPFEDELQDSRQREIYGAARHADPYSGPSASGVAQENGPSTTLNQSVAHEKGAGLLAYVDRGLAVLLKDQRNVLILLLSILIMYVLTGTNGTTSTSMPSTTVGSEAPPVATMTVTSTATFHSRASLANELSSATSLLDLPGTVDPPASSTASVDQESSVDPMTLGTNLQNLAEAILPESAESLEQDER